MSGDLIVARMDTACLMLLQAKNATEAKHVADFAHAAEIYARRSGLGDEAIRYARELKLDAERSLGQFLKAAPKAKGTAGMGRPHLGGRHAQPPKSQTLADLHITKDLSSRAQTLASLPLREFERVKKGDVTITDLKRARKETRREATRQENRAKIVGVEQIADAKFSTILIDPPWDWGDEGDVDQLGRARPDYATMPFDDLMALKIPAADDCHLYLWITNRSLPKGFPLLERWGFRYITCVTWVKPTYGMGNYFRGRTEHLLFGVRGSQPLKRKDAPTVLLAPRGPKGHSSKPVEIYEFVESCSFSPYLEMFSRSDRDDWTSWGEGS